jgi:hypothetical protein
MKKENENSGCLVFFLILTAPIWILIEAAKKSK